VTERVELPRSAPPASGSAELFGHPKGLTFLFTTEMWERFSFYGMRSLLVLYMTKYLLLAEHSETVIGLSSIKHALEAVFGPLAVQPLSSQIWGFYTALVYFTPIFGGLLADRVLGRRHTVVVGAVLMAIGHFMMAIEPLFLFALLLLIIGSGAFKPNISTQVGGLYAPGDHRRDRAYSIFYVGINVGAFLAPLVCGTLGEEVGWHYGFVAAGVGMCIGLCIYLYALPLLPADEFHTATPTPARPQQPLTRAEWRAILALLVLFIPNTLFWGCYEQMGNTIVLWADTYTDRTIHLFGLTAQIPTTSFLAFNPFMIFAFTPLVVSLWTRQAARSNEPSTIDKMTLGCCGLTVAYLIMALGAYHSGGAKASWLWLLGFFVVLTLGELYLSPVGLSFVTKVAPVRLLSMLMGVWLASSFTGGFLAGWLGSFFSRMEKPEFFLMIAGIAALAGLMIFACRWTLRGIATD
jgi:proton-dependent oligopeptide transporter, POT family